MLVHRRLQSKGFNNTAYNFITLKKSSIKQDSKKDIILWDGYPRSRCIHAWDKHFCSSYNMAEQIETDPAGEYTVTRTVSGVDKRNSKHPAVWRKE